MSPSPPRVRSSSNVANLAASCSHTATASSTRPSSNITVALLIRTRNRLHDRAVLVAVIPSDHLLHRRQRLVRLFAHHVRRCLLQQQVGDELVGH